jgi:hypothetical protein
VAAECGFYCGVVEIAVIRDNLLASAKTPASEGGRYIRGKQLENLSWSGRTLGYEDRMHKERAAG